MGLTFRREDSMDEMFAKFASDPKTTVGDTEAGKGAIGQVRAEQEGITLSEVEKMKEVDPELIERERKAKKIIK